MTQLQIDAIQLPIRVELSKVPKKLEHTDKRSLGYIHVFWKKMVFYLRDAHV